MKTVSLLVSGKFFFFEMQNVGRGWFIYPHVQTNCGDTPQRRQLC
ncbi:MAG TPA: hypothetical protein VK798_15510 [Alloacidobacterium sp.]|nr:hypothetical protein [Alloacidobacterium sp.]